MNTGGFDPLPRIVRPSARTAAGCTSTAPSGCGRRPTRRAATSSRASGRPTRGRPTPTSGSTCPTTAASRSCADPAAHHAAMTLGAAYYVETDRRRARPVQLGAGVLAPRPRVRVWAALRPARPRRRRRADRADVGPRPAVRRRASADAPSTRVLNEVVLNQVLVRFDDPSGDLEARRCADGRDRRGGPGRRHAVARRHALARARAMRISVCGWSTSEADVDASLAVIRRIADEIRSG